MYSFALILLNAATGYGLVCSSVNTIVNSITLVSGPSPSPAEHLLLDIRLNRIRLVEGVPDEAPLKRPCSTRNACRATPHYGLDLGESGHARVSWCCHCQRAVRHPALDSPFGVFARQ